MAGDIENATRPIVGIENRTPQEVFDIMSDRIKALYPAAKAEAREAAAKKLEEDAKLLNDMRAVYPGDPTGEMGEEAELLQSIADRLRTLGD